jgi:uncharacterized protein
VTIERVRLADDGAAVDTVSAAVHRPTRRSGPAVLLAPGAGGDLDGDGLVAVADTLSDLRHPVVRTNLPHHEAGRAAPRADRSVAALTQLLEAAKGEVGGRLPWVAGGKSYGGRVASMAAAQGMDVTGLLFYGYPLHPPGKPDQLRVDHWPQIAVKTLFLQGERDPFGSPAEVEPHLTNLPRRATLLAVPGGDHSLDVAGVHAPDGVRRPAAEVLARLAEPLGAWLRELRND